MTEPIKDKRIRVKQLHVNFINASNSYLNKADAVFRTRKLLTEQEESLRNASLRLDQARDAFDGANVDLWKAVDNG